MFLAALSLGFAFTNGDATVSSDLTVSTKYPINGKGRLRDHQQRVIRVIRVIDRSGNLRKREKMK